MSQDPRSIVPQVVPDDQDELLTTFVENATTSGIKFAITLFVGGTVITGVLVSGKAFYEDLGNIWDSLAGHSNLPPAQRRAGDIFRKIATEAYALEDTDAPAKRSSEPRPIPKFIHLENARFFGAAPGFAIPTTKRGAYWRGKISSVDGFQLGYLGGDGEA